MVFGDGGLWDLWRVSDERRRLAFPLSSSSEGSAGEQPLKDRKSVGPLDLGPPSLQGCEK